MSGHAIIDDDIIVLAITEEVGAIDTIVIGLLILDEPWQQRGFGVSPAEQIEDGTNV